MKTTANDGISSFCRALWRDAPVQQDAARSLEYNERYAEVFQGWTGRNESRRLEMAIGS